MKTYAGIDLHSSNNYLGIIDEKDKRLLGTFTSLKKTCRKLGLSFWNYLKDRIEQQNKYPPLDEIMATQLRSAGG